MASTPATVADFRGLNDDDVVAYARVALEALFQRFADDPAAASHVMRARLHLDAADNVAWNTSFEAREIMTAVALAYAE